MADQRPPWPSSLARTVDPRIPSNRNILILSTIVAVAMGLFRLTQAIALDQAAIAAAGAGAFTFLAWATGREIDPDHNFSANVAAVATAIALFVGGMSHLLLVGMALVTLRMVSRTTGLSLWVSDALLMVVGVIVTVALTGAWLIGLVVAAGFALNARFAPDEEPNSNVFALMAAALTLVTGTLGYVGAPASVFNPAWFIAAMVVAVAYIAVIMRDPKQLQSTGDFTGQALQYRRVMASRGLALAAGIALILWGGTAGIIALVPVWAAMFGVALRGLLRRP